MHKIPQTLIRDLARATTEAEVERILKDTVIAELFKQMTQFNTNTGILLHDFRGILQNIGARYE